MTNYLFYRQEARKIWQLGSPVALMQIIRMATTVIVTVMIARLGTQALAAIAVTYTLFVILLLFISGISMAIGMHIGRHFGAKALDEVAKMATNGTVLMIILAIPIMIIMHLGKWLFLLCGQKPLIADMAQSYLSALSWAAIPIAIQLGLQQFLLGISKPKALNFFPIISLVVNIPLAYALIFGAWGAPKIGLAGAAYAMTISAWINGILMVLYVMATPAIRRLQLFQHSWPISWPIVKSIFLTGLPIAISIIVEIIYMLILVFFLGLVSIHAQAAYQVVSQLTLIPLMIPFAISQSSTILLSQHLGKGESDRLLSSAILAIIIALLPILLVSLVFWFAPHLLINHFLPPHQAGDHLTRVIAVHMLMISAIIQIVDSIRMTILGAMRGIKDIKMPLYFSLICFWLIGPPFIAAVGLWLKLGPVAMWASDGILVILSTILLGWRFLYKVRAL